MIVPSFWKIRHFAKTVAVLSVLIASVLYFNFFKPIVKPNKSPIDSSQFLNGQYHHDDSYGHISIVPNNTIGFIPVENDRFSGRKKKCRVPSWNKVHTDKIPDAEIHDKWLRLNISNKGYLYHKTPSPFAAYVYEDHIAVTLTCENQFGINMTCRYFDCHLIEIKDPFESVVFPESTVFCARRFGAEYISITSDINSKPEPPVRIQNRIVDEEPEHYFTVCLATLYGPEPKFIQIVDFIEYYKLQGATKIHVYVRNVTDYDRRLLDDYVRTGEIEVITVHDNWWRDDFMWHMSQINDCHFRSKNYAKWTAFIDIDERIQMKNNSVTIVDYLESIEDPNINSLQFLIQWVLKTEPSPETYTNDSQVLENLVFKKYHNTSSVGTILEQPKCIIRPERVGAMTIHEPLVVYKGYVNTLVNQKVAVVRHYRNIYGSLLFGGIQIATGHGPYKATKFNPKIEKKLSKAILYRLNYVYNIHDNFTCLEKQLVFGIHGQIAQCWIDTEQERIEEEEKRNRKNLEEEKRLMEKKNNATVSDRFTSSTTKGNKTVQTFST